MVMDEKENSEKKPIGYRKFGVATLILALVILFLYFFGVFPAFSLPASDFPPTPAPTMSTVTAVGAKDLATR
jgi:hypothetical protein